MTKESRNKRAGKTSETKKISRRKFIETTSAAAGAALVGCNTLRGGQRLSSAKADDSPPEWLAQVATARIHPGIGVARVGNSQATDGFFIGPEVVEPPLTGTNGTRDASGAIKRQAARFRIYGYDANGNVLGEIKASYANINWSVHLANKKAAWYRFLSAMDIEDVTPQDTPRRNPNLVGAARSTLVIDPGERRISGVNISGAAFQLDGGRFGETPVSLGEVCTDAEGRLLVLGGSGKSGSPANTPVYRPEDEDSFNNADGWYDDISDGPVRASLQIGSRDIQVDSGWVFVAPPNFAPDIIGWRTLYDLLMDTYTESGMLPFPARTSFTEHILPALQRLTNLQWVNKGYAKSYGKGTGLDFNDPVLLRKLSLKPAGNAEDPNAPQRKQIFDSFRGTNPAANDGKLWPWLYGDSYGSFTNSKFISLHMSPTRARHFANWVSGDFIDDWNPEASAVHELESLPVAQQPHMLDQAALHFCLADAFHPGCEVTWPMRHASMYRAPFRIKERQGTEVDYGDKLSRDVVLRAGGPLAGQGPGDLTKWMAIPWQGDTVFCRSGYEPEFDPYILTFWPARVPNQVLTSSDYATVMDPNQPRQRRKDAFNRRPHWVRSMTGSAPNQMLQMVEGFDRMGIVEMRPGIRNDPDFPAIMFVESLPAVPLGARSTASRPAAAMESVAKATRSEDLAGWENDAQLKEFKRIKKRSK